MKVFPGSGMVLSPKRKIRDVRRRLSKLIGEDNSSIIVLAIDGIPLRLAECHWDMAELTSLCSEFPSTSSTCWLSSVTGLAPIEHGALGYMQRFGKEQAVELVYAANRSDAFAPGTNIFDDAANAGYMPFCLLGDLTKLSGRWRDRLIKGARIVHTGSFYSQTQSSTPSASELLERLRAKVDDLLSRPEKVFAWCFVDIDLHIHRSGYDPHVVEMLEGIQRLSLGWASRANVIAYSDHGLVPTTTDDDVEEALNSFCREFDAAMAGAGRTRWFHCRRGFIDEHIHQLELLMRPYADVFDKLDLFGSGRYFERIGNPIVVANGERFITAPSYSYDHGGWLQDEITVPYAHWRRHGGDL